ncbi:hypothetical protein AB0N73_09105 [Microbacterium sp. NPDC089189]|uniref:hypothetical protein n=1 Tax=Microbacterium sp. NPDC089189 TaxID=3154972 RepID=UPI003432CEE8
MSFSDDFDRLLDGIVNDAVADVEEQMAEDLAQRCRDAGKTTADDAIIDIEHTPESGDIRVDPERVRARASALLAADRFKF